MAATVHIVTGPAGPGLTARLRTEYLARARETGSALWLAPTDRAAAETLRHAAAAGRPLLAPNVFTCRGLAHAVLARADPDYAVPTASARRLQLEEAVAERVRAGRLEYFRRVADSRGFLEAAEGLLAELEAVGATPSQLAAAAGGERGKGLSACAELAAAFAGRSGDSFAPVVRAARVLSDRPPAPFDRVEAVFVDGAVALAPAEYGLVEALATRADLWISLPTDTGDRKETFEVVQRIRSRWPGAVTVSDIAAVGDRPPGLARLDRHLFGPPTGPGTDSAGLRLIEAPGPVGEARLVARHLRTLIASGVRPDDIVVTARTLSHSRDLLGEVFAEYGLPVDLHGDEPLAGDPAVATLLRAIRLPDEGWPFAGVTALLRSTFFGPRWSEGDAATARRAEGLLRLLGEPRDREAYLRAVRVWAERPPEGLEDERPEDSRRTLKARLAGECQPFLERFFAAWDVLPAAATPEVFADGLRQFARDTGLDPDGVQLAPLWRALEGWTGPSMTRAAFVRALGSVAATEPRPAPAGRAGRVRVVPAEEARHLDCDYLFVVGMGERSFPRLAPPPSLLDDADRAVLRRAGAPFPDPKDRLGAEQRLFLDLVAVPRRGLVLSYPAIDDRGQDLLPGSFLRSVRECFVPEALVPDRQRMLIEGYATRAPLSAAEARVQFAAMARNGADPAEWRHPDLADALCEQLRWADEVATARFRSGDYNRYDGWLDTPEVLAEVRARLGPKKIFSPTALETYVACPFRFMLEHVLGMDELDEPGEEVEQTRRGSAVHRALARLHRRLHAADPDMTRGRVPEQVGAEFIVELDRAVEEYAARAPSPASKKLWELEGRRLRRSAVKYRDQWDGYLDPWRKARAYLAPQLLEADFGLPGTPGGTTPLVISIDGIEVRIGGQIDRVDVAELDGELGYWVIDYKTGRAGNYTSSALTRLEKLQLLLYALAVQRVFFPGRKARPLGLAYWLVTDTGHKAVLPGRAMAWLSDPEAWGKFRSQLEGWVAKVIGRVREGHFPLAPRSANCTDTCPFGQMCRISQSRNVGKAWELRPDVGPSEE